MKFEKIIFKYSLNCENAYSYLCLIPDGKHKCKIFVEKKVNFNPLQNPLRICMPTEEKKKKTKKTKKNTLLSLTQLF